MNIFNKIKANKSRDEWMKGLERKTYRVRIDYPSRYCKFGEVDGEIPRYLSELISKNELIDYFNLVSQPEDHPLICLNTEECMYLANLLLQFRESPISVFRNRVLYKLEDAFEKSPKDQQREILEKYFGPGEVDRLLTGEYPPYYRLNDLSRRKLNAITLDFALTILAKEYGQTLFDLEGRMWNYDEAMRPHAKNGILTVVLKSGEVLNIALKGDEDKTLVFNSDYDDGGPNYNGPGRYRFCGRPCIKTLTSKELHDACGFVEINSYS